MEALAILGNIPAVPLDLLVTIAILIAAFIALGSIANRLLLRVSKNLVKRTKGREQKKLRRMQLQFFRRLFVLAVYLIGIAVILYQIPGMEAASTSLLAGAGVAAVIIGFAVQKSLANIFSGIFIAMNEPFRVGDKLNIDGSNGIVEDMTLRHVVFRTWDNKRIIVPNAKIDDQSIVNYSLVDEKIWGTVEIGIAYDADIDKARKIMLEEANKHPENMVFEDKDEDGNPVEMGPVVRVVEAADFSVKMRLYFWVKDYWAFWKTKFELLEGIKKRFDREGIEIPYPYRTIVYKKDLEAARKPRGSGGGSPQVI